MKRCFPKPASSAFQSFPQTSSLINIRLRCVRRFLSVGTHVFFQLSSSDAGTVSQALDGGKSLAERLKNLPQRHFVLKSGAERWMEVAAYTVDAPKGNYADLVKRVHAQGARPRAEVEQEIQARHAAIHQSTDEVLDAWD